MLNIILNALYFFLPAYIANMTPVLLKWIPWNTPIWKQKFGKNKTWRGLVIGTLTGGLTFWIQKTIFIQGFTKFSLIDYSDFTVLLGFLMAFGALKGDIIKSYYKRKANIKPGISWIPWDQTDFVFGGLLFSLFIYVPPAPIVLILLIISPLLHIITNYIGYLLKINKNKW